MTTPRTKRLVTTAAVLLAALTSACSPSPSKAELDKEVRRLCAIDGGVKVYETVELLPEMFNERSQLNFQIPYNAEDARTAFGYYLESTDTLIAKGGEFLIRSSASLWRYEYRIIRVSDGKTLGTSVRYGRGGGDMWGPWVGSSLTCPDPVKQPSNFETAVFFKGSEK